MMNCEDDDGENMETKIWTMLCYGTDQADMGVCQSPFGKYTITNFFQ